MRLVQPSPTREASDFSNWGTGREADAGNVAREGFPSESLFQHAVVELLFAPVGGGLNKGQDYGMRIFLAGGKLRLK
jgi:hypothetical protein